MPTQYLDYPVNDDQFWRLFGVVLVDAYTGEIQGHLLGQDETNYVVDFYRRMYPQWDAPVPDWLVSQLRYPEFLFERQIDSYNIYHVSNPDKWQKSSDFSAIPLCFWHHRADSDSYHVRGEREFAARHRIDILGLVRTLNAQFQNKLKTNESLL